MTSSTDSYNTVYVNRSALQHNFQTLQKVVGNNVRLLAMIKSDAYGHGLVETALALVDAGAQAFGVAVVEEGIRLREAGVRGEVFVFLSSYRFADLIRYDLTPVVFDRENIQALSAFAAQRNTVVPVHLKVDTGMGRLGVMPDELPTVVDEIITLPGVALQGMLSHFPMADQFDSPSTMLQNRLFDQVCHGVAQKNHGVGRAMNHIANSAALLNFPPTHHDMVRPGISLYGCYPSAENGMKGKVDLQPVMSFHTKIIQLKDVPAGYGVSYGHIEKTSRPARLAILPVGYADGYLRSLTGKAEVLIKGRRAAVCGRVCMNATVVDVTGIADVKVLDEVVLLGTQACGDYSGEITADEIAGWMGTINYEVLCLFGNNNPRVYR